MLTLQPLQRALTQLYGLGGAALGVLDVDAFVQRMPDDSAHVHRREALLVSARRRRDGSHGATLLLHDDVFRALRGESVSGFCRFDAWCAAVEGVSHLTFLTYRAAHGRPVTQLELELQAEVDKYALALLDRAHLRAAGEGERISRQLRAALYRAVRFLDAERSLRGVRYRTANRWADRYAASLERRYVRHGRLDGLVHELRGFYRRGIDDKRRVAQRAVAA